MKSLWDFLAQNHKGTIHGTTRWWAVFVEGAGNEEQPTDTHPEISKHTVWRRNCLSVFYLSPHGRLKINSESCHQKALRQWIWKMRHRNPKGSMRGKESALGSSARRSDVFRQSRPHQRAMPELWIHKHFTEPGRGREQLVGKIGSSRATYCLAMLLSALSNWLSQRIGGGEFHKLNPENIEKGGGGENSDSQGMFSSERCFLLLQ